MAFNVGQRPVYRYGRRHYRRVLQVLRLYARGIRQTDEILIMLFLNSYGVKPHEVREPLAREFAPRSMLRRGQSGSTKKAPYRPSTRRASFGVSGRLTTDLWPRT
jgi:hypothetical protein